MILLDISTSYQFRHWKPMGILRVEREVIKGFTQHLGDDVAMGIYDPGTRAYYRIPEEIFEEIVFQNGIQPKPPERAQTARSRWHSWMRVAWFLHSPKELHRSCRAASVRMICCSSATPVIALLLFPQCFHCRMRNAHSPAQCEAKYL